MTTPRFAPEHSDAAARVRTALKPGARPVQEPNRMFGLFAAAVVNQILTYTDDAMRSCGQMLGPTLPPPTFARVTETGEQADAAAAVAFASRWIGACGAGASGPDRSQAALWFRTRTRVLPGVVTLAMEAGWDQQCWQIAARCHEALVAEDALAEATANATAGLAAAERCADRQGIAAMHLACVSAAKMRGDLDEATAHYDKAMPLLQELGDVRGQAKAMLCRGAVHTARRELQAARDCQLAILEITDTPALTALATGNLARIALDNGEIHEAIRCGTAALRIIDGAGIPAIRQVMEVHHNLAEAHLVLGELPAARRHVAAARNAAEATAQDMNFASVHVAVYLAAGQLALAENEPETALNEFTRASAVRSDSTCHLADLLEGIGRAILACGDSISAVAVLHAALAQRRVDRLDLYTAGTLVHLAAAHEDHDPQQAAALRAEALAHLKPLTDQPAARLREALAAA